MIEWLSNLDKSILLWIHQTTSNSMFDSFFPIYTDIHKVIFFSVPALLLIIFFFIKKYKRAGLTYFVFLCLSVALNDFTGKLVKNNYPRMRPYTVTELNITAKSHAGPTSSFYSNHTSNSFAFATYVTQFFPGAKFIVFPIAALTGFSRMYNGVHYPSDVVAGALIGSLIGWLVSLLARRVVQKIQLRENRL